jgi:ribosomal-protein-alanine N-acetyltransferase
MKCATIPPKLGFTQGDENLPYYVRLMRPEDIAQAMKIDREAFPTQWPPPSFQHELRNQLAHYIVVCDDEKTVDNSEVKANSEKGLAGLVSRLGRLFGGNHLSNNEAPAPSNHCITGYVGFWIMADEAHITSIAVREAYRRQGLGELLLISAIDLATELKANIVTLEVRVSNTIAQNLYTKYSFTEVGIRPGYYVDNREDGLVMSTQDIASTAFQVR